MSFSVVIIEAPLREAASSDSSSDENAFSASVVVPFWRVTKTLFVFNKAVQSLRIL